MHYRCLRWIRLPLLGLGGAAARSVGVHGCLRTARRSVRQSYVILESTDVSLEPVDLTARVLRRTRLVELGDRDLHGDGSDVLL